MEIRHFSTISRTVVISLAVRGWMELIETDRSDGGVLIAWDQKAIVAFGDDDAAIGVLTWTDQEWMNQIFVNLAYVVPERRRQGVHTAMWRALIEKALELKRPFIVSGAIVTNVASRAMMKAQGREEYAVLTKFAVPRVD